MLDAMREVDESTRDHSEESLIDSSEVAPTKESL
jgi:hypothetical protein